MDRIGLAILEQELAVDATVMVEAARLAELVAGASDVSEAFPKWARHFCAAIRAEL